MCLLSPDKKAHTKIPLSIQHTQETGGCQCRRHSVFSSARNISGHPKESPKPIKPLIVSRRAVHKHSLCCHSCGVSEYSCTAPCFMDASSVFLHQKLTSEGLSGMVITTKTLPTKASPTCLNVEPRRKWEFYLVNSTSLQHSNYNTKSDNAADGFQQMLLLTARFLPNGEGGQSDKVPSATYGCPPSVVCWQWYQVSTLPSEVTTESHQY